MAAVVALFSLLYMQLAVAAYACPMFAPVQQQAAMLDASGQPMANCPDIKERPSLCKAYTQKAPQALDKGEPPSVHPFAVLGFVSYVVVPEEPVQPGFTIAASFLHAQSTAPPIAIRNCCFRL